MPLASLSGSSYGTLSASRGASSPVLAWTARERGPAMDEGSSQLPQGGRPGATVSSGNRQNGAGGSPQGLVRADSSSLLILLSALRGLLMALITGSALEPGPEK
jgi:hypothetical protein